MKKTSIITGSALMLSLAMALPTYAQGMNGGAGRGQGQNQQGMGQLNERRGQQAPGVTGAIASISGTTITVTSRAMGGSSDTATTYTVDASSATIKKLTMPSSTTAGTKPTETVLALSDLAVGNTVIVAGTVTGTAVKATAITVGEFPGRRGEDEGRGLGRDAKNGLGLSGSVTAVSGTTLTVKTDARGNQAEASYTVDASAATVKKIVEPTTDSAERTETTVSVSTIAVGDSLIIKGTVTGTTVTATEITIRANHDDAQLQVRARNGQRVGQQVDSAADHSGSQPAAKVAQTQATKQGFFAKLGNSFKNFFGKFKSKK